MDVFLVSAFPMFNKKASQPPSVKTSNSLLLASCSPPVAIYYHPVRREQESAKRQHYRVGGEVRNYMLLYVYG